MRKRQGGQAIVELAIGMGALMLLLTGLVAASIITATELGLVAVVQEAAHMAALSATPSEATLQGEARGLQVGRGYPLGNGSLGVQVDASQFVQGGRVEASATYTLTSQDLFLFGLSDVRLSRDHAEPVALHRGLP